ncbi:MULTISPECIES: aminoacyl-tRNA hydrolase [Kocuria]|uniref:aminoacyl-tRNA hydrolase n=1 Tax=Kocuria TaxID=57493 RepID=UPI0006612A0B|nr:MULTISPECIES: aminoacyl-tRNA hydrolase [Kocuria]MCT1366530.1 aminoacyl-tRNA hydrolase [Rothia sp. p3-SID1597]RUQ21337.1 aminoacyl-tRNA hydrolase [Kocuria sp. HSID16901]
MSETWLVIGLGNPGPQYADTRHNVGQMVVDTIARSMGASFKRHKAGAVVVEGRLGIGGPRVVLAKSTGYMNTSGGPTSALAQFYGVDPEHVIAVHDEIDIPFDTIKLKRGGGEGGHNGLRDISKALSTKDYVRVRVGVGRPPGRMDTADYVLKGFSSAESKELPMLLVDAADAVEMVMTAGLTETQQKFHAR